MVSLLRLLVCVSVLWGAIAAAWATPVLRYGVYDNAPKIFWDRNGQAAGIWPDLLEAWAAQQGWLLEPVRCDWTRCLEMLERAELDFMPDVAWAADRQQRFDFHQTPVFYSWSQLYVQPGQAITSLLDLDGRAIAVLQGSVQEQFLRDTLRAFGVEPRWVVVDSLVRGFEMLERGEVDAAAANRFYGDQQAVQRRLVGSAVVFQPAQLFVATPRGRHADVLASIDAQMARWKADPDSVYFNTLRRWAGSTDVRYEMPVSVFWVLGGALGLTLLAFGVSLWFRRQVRRVTADLRASRDQLNTILDGVGASVFIKDRQGGYQYANRAALGVLNTDADHLIGRTDQDFFDTETAARLRAIDEHVFQTGEQWIEEENNRLSDERGERTELTVKMPLRNERGDIYAVCGIATDLSAFREAEQAIHALTNYDPLTRLPNRRLLMDRLQHSLASYQRSHHEGAVLLLDMDGFSLLNNTMGYDKGDQLLRLVAERLAAHCRSQDTLARLSSDEFVLLLNDLSEQPSVAAEQVQHVLDKIGQVFDTPFEIDGQPHIASACVGVALFSDADSPTDDLLKLADLAVHQAKQQGRGARVFFNPEMQAHARQIAQVEADLRVALAEQQFLLEYQPQVDQSGQVIGVEALVRWRHPQRGVHFALDDFGTGYSSLNYLRQFPLNRLKIDKSFVDDVATQPSDAAIVKTIVTLAQSLELSVIAEGVETHDQWQALQTLGVRHAQGFLFSRPVPVNQLTRVYAPVEAWA